MSGPTESVRLESNEYEEADHRADGWRVTKKKKKNRERRGSDMSGAGSVGVGGSCQETKA